MKRLKLLLRKYWWLFAIILVIGYGIVSNLGGTAGEPYLGSYDSDFYYAEESMAVMSSDRSSGGFMYEDEVSSGEYEAKIMRSGSLTLHVDNVQEAAEAMQLYVDGLGGAVLSSSVTRGGSSYSGYLTVRVPAESFEDAMAGLKELALYVNYEYTNADDITETYMDLEARLNNLQAEEAQYLEIMNMSGTVEEILQVTAALADVRYEIETTESSLAYYDARVDYSTIDLTLSEDESVSAVTETWRPISTIRDAFSDWIVTLQGLVDWGIYLAIYLWPVAVGILVWRWVKRKRG